MPKGEKLAELNLRRAISMRERQLSNYTISESGCWVWNGKKDRDGYGCVKREGISISTHRLFYKVYKGSIPEGMLVLHTCDNPSCVNPKHLYVGTQLDNERDKTIRGRRPPSPSITHPEKLPRGEKHHRFGKGMPSNIAEKLLKANLGRPLTISHKEALSSINLKLVTDIRNASGTQLEIATRFGVSQMTVSRIKRGERWAYL